MNRLIEQYFNQIELRMVESPAISNYDIIRKEISDSDGKIRVRITTSNNDLADLFEYMNEVNGRIEVKKYHFHWQDENNQLIQRWDNAPHHKELDNFPHHIHFPDKVVSADRIPDILYVIGEIEVKLIESE